MIIDLSTYNTLSNVLSELKIGMDPQYEDTLKEFIVCCDQCVSLCGVPPALCFGLPSAPDFIISAQLAPMLKDLSEMPGGLDFFCECASKVRVPEQFATSLAVKRDEPHKAFKGTPEGAFAAWVYIAVTSSYQETRCQESIGKGSSDQKAPHQDATRTLLDGGLVNACIAIGQEAVRLRARLRT